MTTELTTAAATTAAAAIANTHTFDRTHYCGDVDAALASQSVSLYGWVNRVRNHGKLIFIDLRDRAGTVQVVVNDASPELFALAAKLHNEYVIHINGTVQLRPQGLINKDMRTGTIEVVAQNLAIINAAESLPFNIDATYQDANEELKLRYRYLDLRRPEMAERIMIRAKIARVIRAYLDAQQFIEIETPMLTKSTPEGARDYLVPSRNFPGQFYALPQSPQIFKQLLMASGLDRYYQIVRCFRDEDLRADRQPEFTQLDIEMSFINEEQLYEVIEGLMQKLFAEILGVHLPRPFPRLTYVEAMMKYGSDRPDLRIPLELVEIKDLFLSCVSADKNDGNSSSNSNSNSNFFTIAAQDAKSRIAAMRMPNGAKLSRKQLDVYTEVTKSCGAKMLGYIKVNDRTPGVGLAGIQTSLLKFLTAEILENILLRTQTQAGDIVFLIADKNKVVNDALGTLRVRLAQDHNLCSCEENNWRPLWVVDFPMFEQKDDDSWTFLHHPFTAPQNSDPEELRRNPGSAIARAYDMVLNGMELGGGSIRIHDLGMQLTVFDIIGINHDVAYQQFGHLLESFKYGYPPEGGIAFGLDRIAMILTHSKSLREVIAFPKTQTACCPLTQAPSSVSTAQLQELGIAIRSSKGSPKE